MKFLKSTNFWTNLASASTALAFLFGVFIYFYPKNNNQAIALPESTKVVNNLSEGKLITTIPFGASLNSPKNISVLQVEKEGEKSYSLSENINVGDIIVFEIHSFANKSPIQNVFNKLVDLDNKIFAKDSTANISAVISATGIPSLTGTVSLHFNDNVKFKFAGYKWYKKKEGNNPGKSKKYDLPNNQDGSLIIKNGVLLGALPVNYRSNLLVRFKTYNPE